MRIRLENNRQGEVMTMSACTLLIGRMSVLFICVLLASSLRAQTAPENKNGPNTPVQPETAPEDEKAPNAPIQTVPPGQAADPSGTKPHDDSFMIGNDDLLAINVWKEPEISRSVPVRSDGKISLPLVGEVQANGRTPLKLEQDIATRLKNYIAEPEVTVIVQQINSQKFNVLGQVARPGSYTVANSPTVLDAIALAGGFRDFAKQKSIYILRQNSEGKYPIRLRFNYKEVIKGKNPGQNVKLQPRDTVVVP